MLANFFIALTAFAGAIVTLIFSLQSQSLISFLIPFAAGNFIYIATADLLPELHKNSKIKSSIIQLTFFILGILMMAGLLFLEI